jgi:hypothetical protein
MKSCLFSVMSLFSWVLCVRRRVMCRFCHIKPWLFCARTVSFSLCPFYVLPPFSMDLSHEILSLHHLCGHFSLGPVSWNPVLFMCCLLYPVYCLMESFLQFSLCYILFYRKIPITSLLPLIHHLAPFSALRRLFPLCLVSKWNSVSSMCRNCRLWQFCLSLKSHRVQVLRQQKT